MNIKYFLSIVLVAILVTGCASTGGSHKLVTAPLSSTQSAKYKDLIISVQPASNVTFSQSDADRMTKMIAENIKSEAPSRFTSINSPTPSSNALQASVAVKRYEEGSAFARVMLAGLGQIHIDADVILSDAATKDKLAQYEVTKTFAWGGAYGAFTGIKDAEVGFSKAVADSILVKD